MDKIMAKKWAKRAGATLLCAAALVGGVLGVGYGTGLFDSGEDASLDSVLDDGSGLIVGDANGHGMSIAKTTVGPTANSYTLEATITPSYATDPDITWSVAWDSTSSKYSSTWSSYPASTVKASTASVSDYVTLSSTTGSSVTVTCSQAFGCPIIVTATSDDDSSITATCQLDYQQRITGISIIDGDTYSAPTTLTCSSSSNDSLVLETKLSYSVGTIDIQSTEIEYETITLGAGLSSYLDSTVWNLNSVETGTESVTSVDTTVEYSFSKDWTTLVKSFLNSTVTYQESYLNDFYTAVSSAGVSNVEIGFFEVSVKDAFTGSTYSANVTIYLTSLNDYPTFDVTGITLNESQIIF